MMVTLLWVTVLCLLVGPSKPEDTTIEEESQTTVRNIPHGLPRSLFSSNAPNAEHGPGSKIAYHIKIQKSDNKSKTEEVRHVNLTFTNKQSGLPPPQPTKDITSSHQTEAGSPGGPFGINSGNPTIYILSNFLNELRANRANISVTGPVVHLKRLNGSEESYPINLRDLSYQRGFTPSDQTVYTPNLSPGVPVSTERVSEPASFGNNLTPWPKVEATTFRPSQRYFPPTQSGHNNEENNSWSPINTPTPAPSEGPEHQSHGEQQSFETVGQKSGETSPRWESIVSEEKKSSPFDSTFPSPYFVFSDSLTAHQLSGVRQGDTVYSSTETSSGAPWETVDNSKNPNSPANYFEKPENPPKSLVFDSVTAAQAVNEKPNVNNDFQIFKVNANVFEENLSERNFGDSLQSDSLYSTEYAQQSRGESIDNFHRFNTHLDQHENTTPQHNVSDDSLFSRTLGTEGSATLRPELFNDYTNEVHSTASDFTNTFGWKNDVTEFWERPADTTSFPEGLLDWTSESNIEGKVSTLDVATKSGFIIPSGLSERPEEGNQFGGTRDKLSTPPFSNGRLYLRLEDILGGENNYGNKESIPEQFLIPFGEESTTISGLDVDFIAENEKIDLFGHDLEDFDDTNKIKRKLATQQAPVVFESFLSTPSLPLFSAEGESDVFRKRKKNKKLLSRVLIDVPTYSSPEAAQSHARVGENDFSYLVPGVSEETNDLNSVSSTTTSGLSVSPGQGQHGLKSFVPNPQHTSVHDTSEPEHVTPCLKDGGVTDGLSREDRIVEDPSLTPANSQPNIVGGIPESRGFEQNLATRNIDTSVNPQQNDDKLHSNRFRAQRRKDTWLTLDEQEVEEPQGFESKPPEECSSDFISQIKSVLGTKYYESLLTLINTAKNNRKSREVQIYNQNSVLNLDKYASDESKHVKQNIELLLNRLGYTLTGSGGKVSLKPVSDLSEDLTQSILQSDTQETDPNKKFVVLISSLNENTIKDAAKGHYTLTRLGDLDVNGNSVSLPLETLSQGSLEDIQSKSKILDSGIPASIAETILKSFTPPKPENAGNSDDSLSKSNVQIIQINPKDDSPIRDKVKVPETGDPEVKSTIYSILEGITSGKLRADSDAPLILASELDYNKFFKEKLQKNGGEGERKDFGGEESIKTRGSTEHPPTRSVYTNSSLNKLIETPNPQPQLEAAFIPTTILPPFSNVDLDTNLYGIPAPALSGPSEETGLFGLGSPGGSTESDIAALLSPESRVLLGSKNLVPVIKSGENFLVPSEYLSTIQSLPSELAQLHPQTQLSEEGYANLSPLLSYAINNYAKPELSRDFASSIDKYMKNLPKTKDKYTTIDLSQKRPAVPHVRPHGSGEPPENIPQTISINDFADVLRHQTKLSGGQLVLEKVSVVPKGSTKPVSLIQASITPTHQEFFPTTPISISKPSSLFVETTSNPGQLTRRPTPGGAHVANKPLYTVKPNLPPTSGASTPPERLQYNDHPSYNKPVNPNSQTSILSLPSVGKLKDASVSEIPELVSVYSESPPGDKRGPSKQDVWQPLERNPADSSTAYGGQVHNSPSKFKFSSDSDTLIPQYYAEGRYAEPENRKQSSLGPEGNKPRPLGTEKLFFPQDSPAYPYTNVRSQNPEQSVHKVSVQSGDSRSINSQSVTSTGRLHSEPSEKFGPSEWRPLAGFDQGPGKFSKSSTPKPVQPVISPDKLYNVVDTHSDVVTDIQHDENGGPIGSVSYSTSHGNAGRSTFRISFGGSSKSPARPSLTPSGQGSSKDAVIYADAHQFKSDVYAAPDTNPRRSSTVQKSSILPNDAEISQVKHFQTGQSGQDVAGGNLDNRGERLKTSHSVSESRPKSSRPLQKNGPAVQTSRDPPPYAYLNDFNSEKTSLNHGPLHASSSDSLFVDTVSGDGLVTSLTGAGAGSPRKGRTFDVGGQFVNRYKLSLGENDYLNVLHKSSADGTSITYSRD